MAAGRSQRERSIQRLGAANRGLAELRSQDIPPKGRRAKPGAPQVVMNHSGPRDAWRFIRSGQRRGDRSEQPFLVRAKRIAEHSLLTLWAVMFSPVANAYAYSWSGKRHTLASEWLAMPLPDPTSTEGGDRGRSRRRTSKLAVPPSDFTLTPPDEPAIRRALLELDAAVLRVYDLPPALERQLLAIFDGVETPGRRLHVPRLSAGLVQPPPRAVHHTSHRRSAHLGAHCRTWPRPFPKR